MPILIFPIVFPPKKMNYQSKRLTPRRGKKRRSKNRFCEIGCESKRMRSIYIYIMVLILQLKIHVESNRWGHVCTWRWMIGGVLYGGG